MILLDVVNGTETFLSDLAPIPVIGRVAGIMRVGFGCVQTITALALSILLAVPSLMIPNIRSTWSNCSSHIFKGIENIIAGIFESTPFIGVMF